MIYIYIELFMNLVRQNFYLIRTKKIQTSLLIEHSKSFTQ